MREVVIKISQGSVVTQSVLGGLFVYTTIHLPVANFLCFISAKNYENWLRVDKVIAMNTLCSFLAHPVYTTTVNQMCCSTNLTWLNHRNLFTNTNLHITHSYYAISTWKWQIVVVIMWAVYSYIIYSHCSNKQINSTVNLTLANSAFMCITAGKWLQKT